MSAPEPMQFHDGAAYEQRIGRFSALVAEEFLAWLAQPPGLRWLDVGCGSGAFTAQVAARCAPAHLDAIDPSEHQLAYARTRVDVGPAQFVVGAAEALPYAADAYDVAVMALVISFLADPAGAAAELARVVRPGGWAATYMWDVLGDGLPIAPIYTAMRALEIPGPNPPGAEISALDRMRSVWEVAGFTGVETRVIRIPVAYPSFEEFWETNSAPVGPTGRVLAGLPAPSRDRLRAHLAETMPRNAAGGIAYGAHANAVKGRVR